MVSIGFHFTWVNIMNGMVRFYGKCMLNRVSKQASCFLKVTILLCRSKSCSNSRGLLSSDSPHSHKYSVQSVFHFSLFSKCEVGFNSLF